MPLFSYRAVDSDGTPVEGTMDETSAARVAAILDERGLQVSRIEPVTQRQGLLSLQRRLSWRDIQTLNDQLLAVTKSHLPLVPALESMAHDIKSPRLRKVLREMRAELEQGRSLEEALDQYADQIPFTYRSLIRAGERSGNLPGVLTVAAAHSRRMMDVRNSMQMALAYPMIVAAMTLAFMVVFLYYIVPVYAETFSDARALPWMTRFWIDLSDAVRENTLGLVIVGVALVLGVPIALRVIRRIGDGAFYTDWLRERVPIFGKTYGQITVARFARSLGTLLSSGVPTVESLDLASAAAGNGSLRRAVREATERVAAGERVADALSDTGYFTHTFCWLLSTGEQRGEVEPALFSIAETYERDIRRRDRLVEFLMMPVMILFIGIALAAVVTSVYWPMFSNTF